MKFNINEQVKVRLTPYGRALLEVDDHQFWEQAGYQPVEYTAPEEDSEGWSKWQLWELMHCFGKYLSNGGRVPFETEIKILE